MTTTEGSEDITMYMHCLLCMKKKPPGVSMRNYARLSIGFTAEGYLQVWCNRHDIEVAIAEQEGAPN